MHPFCLDYSAANRQHDGVFRLDLPRVLVYETNDLGRAMRRWSNRGSGKLLAQRDRTMPEKPATANKPSAQPRIVNA